MVRKRVQEGPVVTPPSAPMPWAQATDELAGASTPNTKLPARPVAESQVRPESPDTQTVLVPDAQPTVPSTKTTPATLVPGAGCGFVQVWPSSGVSYSQVLLASRSTTGTTPRPSALTAGVPTYTQSSSAAAGSPAGSATRVHS